MLWGKPRLQRPRLLFGHEHVLRQQLRRYDQEPELRGMQHAVLAGYPLFEPSVRRLRSRQQAMQRKHPADM